MRKQFGRRFVDVRGGRRCSKTVREARLHCAAVADVAAAATTSKTAVNKRAENRRCFDGSRGSGGGGRSRSGACSRRQRESARRWRRRGRRRDSAARSAAAKRGKRRQELLIGHRARFSVRGSGLARASANRLFCVNKRRLSSAGRRSFVVGKSKKKRVAAGGKRLDDSREQASDCVIDTRDHIDHVRAWLRSPALINESASAQRAFISDMRKNKRASIDQTPTVDNDDAETKAREQPKTVVAYKT